MCNEFVIKLNCLDENRVKALGDNKFEGLKLCVTTKRISFFGSFLVRIDLLLIRKNYFHDT